MYNYDWWSYDKDIMKDFNHFLKKINTRSCINLGFIDEEYNNLNRHGEIDYGLGMDVEYFHPTITLDDRMRYIGTVIAQHNMSKFNILGNGIISHFYGARGVHMAVTNSTDPNDCFVDFDKLADNDKDYLGELRNNIEIAKTKKRPIWGTTELHTSIQAASRNYCRQKYNDPDRAFHPVDVVDWVSSFKYNGTYKKLSEAQNMQQAYVILRQLPGIGEYYGFHGAASTSVLPQMKYYHDDKFCAPGPGAVYLINRMWPDAPRKLHAEAVYFLRENGEECGLTKDVWFHPEAYNINMPDGSKLFREEQDGLKYYGTEVLSCQFGIYLQIREDKKLCEKRKVSRATELTDQNTLEEFFV